MKHLPQVVRALQQTSATVSSTLPIRDSSTYPKNSAGPKKQPDQRTAEELQRFIVLKAAETQIFENAHRDFDVQAVMAVCERALSDLNSKSRWRAFIDLPFWRENVNVKGGRPQMAHHPRRVKYALRMFCGGDSRKASLLWRSIGPLMEHGDIHCIGIAFYCAGSWKELASLITQDKRAQDTGASARRTPPKHLKQSAAEPARIEAATAETSLPHTTSGRTSVPVELVFEQNLSDFTRLPTPCTIQLLGVIERMEKRTTIRVERFERRL